MILPDPNESPRITLGDSLRYPWGLLSFFSSKYPRFVGTLRTSCACPSTAETGYKRYPVKNRFMKLPGMAAFLHAHCSNEMRQQADERLAHGQEKKSSLLDCPTGA